MKLIGSLGSPYVRKARITLAEKKIDYKLVLENVWGEETAIHDFNPLGKVPCLVMDDGEAVFDSRVICEYVDMLSPVGKLIPPAGRERIAAMPDLPAIAEYAGGSNPDNEYKDFHVQGWLGLLAPARTPREQVDYLTGVFLSALQTPELNARLLAQGLYPDATCGPAFTQRLRRDYEYYGRVIREARIAG